MSSDTPLFSINQSSLVKLGHNNYRPWLNGIKPFLQSRKLFGYVRGTEARPSDDDEEALDEFKDNLEAAAGVIKMSLDESQLVHIQGIEDDPQKMWKTLEDVHLPKQATHRFSALSTVLNTQKLPDEPLPSALARVRQSMQQFKALWPPKDYTIDSLVEDIECMAAIRMLGPEHSTFVSAISLLDTISMDKLEAAFRTEQSSIDSALAKAQAIAAANVVSLICGWCECPGHSEENCFSKKAAHQAAKENTRQKKAQRGKRRGKPSHPSNSNSNSNSTPSTSTSNSFSADANVAGQDLEFAGNASALSTTLPTPSADWCADTGASSHMTPHKEWFATYTPHVIPVRVADGNIIFSAGVGVVQFKPILGGGAPGRVVEFKRVLHVPQLNRPLLSITTLTLSENYEFLMKGAYAQFLLNGSVAFLAHLVHNLPILLGSTVVHPVPASANNTTAAPMDIVLWHRRFSHFNYPDLTAMASKKLVTGLVIKSTAVVDPICEPCIAGNQRRIVNKTATRQKTPLHLVHSDVHGPMPTQTPEGWRYWVVFVDDFSRHWAVYFMRRKDRVFECFKAYKAWVELATGHKIKVFHDDKGGEYIPLEFSRYLESCGIQRRHTMRNEPHSNGVAERSIGIQSNRATSLLHESKLPPSFWARAVSTVVHTHNRMTTSSLPNSTPYQSLFGTKPDVSLLRVFGSLAYVHIQKDKRIGLSPHTEKAIFVGYPPGYKGWGVL